MKNTNLQEFIKYTTGNVMGMIGLSCYILADTFFISKGLGASGLAALNLAIPVYSFVHGSGLMIGMGGATKYSIYRGLKAERNAAGAFTCSLVWAVVIAVMFMLIGLLGAEKLTYILGANEEVFEMTEVYLKVILLFAPGFILNDLFLCFVRNDGNPGLAMAAMLTGSFSNIILDYIFIFPLQMGMFGAVLATGMAAIISLGILMMHVLKKKNGFHLIKGRKSFTMSVSVFSLGFSSLIGEVASGIVMIAFNIIILGIQGNVGVAAYGVIANLALVVTSVCTGVAQGMQPLTSKAYGSGEKHVMIQVLRYALLTVIMVSLVIYAVLIGFADPIVSVFNSEKNALLQESALRGLKLYFLSIPFMGCNIVLSMFFASMEKAFPAQAISLLRGVVLLLPMALLLSAAAGMTGVWLTVLITEGLVLILGVFFTAKQNDLKCNSGM